MIDEPRDDMRQSLADQATQKWELMKMVINAKQAIMPDGWVEKNNK